MSIKIATLYAELKADDNLNPALVKTKQNLGAASAGVSKFGTDAKKFFQIAATSLAAVTGMAASVRALMNEFTEGANKIRPFVQLTGESAEEMSRLVEVLDDFKISSEDAMLAQRSLAQKGMTLTIDSLAKMSDAYLALNDGAERQRYLSEQLGGRVSQRFIEIMSQGGDSIRARSEAISEGLIYDERALVLAREYEFALDEWNDTLREAKYLIGEEIMPLATDFIGRMTDGFHAWQQFPGQIREIGSQLQRIGALRGGFWGDLQRFGGGLDIGLTGGAIGIGEQISGQADELDSATQSALALAESYMPEIDDRTEDITSSTRDWGEYLSKITDYAEHIAESEERRAALTDELEQAVALYGENSTKARDLRNEIGTLDKQTSTWANQFILSLYQMQLAADGVIDESDVQKILAMGEGLGILDRNAVEAAQHAWELAEQLVALPGDIRHTVEYLVSVTGDVDQALALATGNAGFGAQAGYGASVEFQASGGQLSPSRWTVVGERGFEVISPSGHVYPHSQAVHMLRAGMRMMQTGGPINYWDLQSTGGAGGGGSGGGAAPPGSLGGLNQGTGLPGTGWGGSSWSPPTPPEYSAAVIAAAAASEQAASEIAGAAEMVTAAAAMIAASVQVTASSTAQQTQVIQSGDATTNAILTELVSEVRSLNNNIAASVGDAVQQGLAG